jgi:pilus assembly protein CpaF
MLDGTRRVTHVSEIVGVQGSVVTLQDLFVFQHQGLGTDGAVQGVLQATGMRPRFMERLAQYGEHLPVETFLPLPTEPDPAPPGPRRSTP